jgi:hypothetical protein
MSKVYTMFHVPRFIDHYEYLPDKTPEMVNIPSNECLICLEIYTDDKVAPIDWKKQELYLKFCRCGGWLHICCVNKWYSVANTCPICRQFMTISDSNSFTFFIDLNEFHISKVFVFIIYSFQIWNIFVWSIIASLWSYHIYTRYDATTDSNIFTNDDDGFPLDYNDPGL